jgi:hypothetical protein
MPRLRSDGVSTGLGYFIVCLKISTCAFASQRGRRDKALVEWGLVTGDGTPTQLPSSAPITTTVSVEFSPTT